MPKPATPKITLMQKILGRHYKWWYLMQYNFRLAYLDRMGIFITVLRFSLPLLITTMIYTSFEGGKALTSELAMTNYFFQFTAMAFGISWDLRLNIIKGGLSNKLLQPTNYIDSQLFVALGFNSFTLLLRTLVYIPILLYFNSPLIFGWNLIITLLLISVSFVTFLCLEIIIGCSAFWFNVASNRILEIYYDIISLLSGSIILLEINSITKYFINLPFSIGAYHPMQLYLGKYDTAQTLLVFASGITWCIVLYFLAKLVFRLGLKRNEAVGL